LANQILNQPVSNEMPNLNIVTCYPLSDSQAAQIQAAAGEEYQLIVSSQEKIGEDIFLADIFCGHAKVPVDWPAVVERGRLKWIQSSAAGLDHCLTPAVIESDILVSGCSGLFANQVAEQMMALLMGLIRRMPVFYRAQQKKEYIRRPTDDLFGKTVGIAGLGGNGQRIAKVLRPMAGRIIATDLFHEHCQSLVGDYATGGLVDEVLPADELEAFLPQADIVIVTLPLTEGNENRIGAEQFRLFKSGAYLVNVGRGCVVETKSLVESLKLGRLGGVGIDVVEPEPLPTDSPLWEMDNVIISPHVGAQSARRLPATANLFCENLKRFAASKSLKNQVDKKLGFPRPEHRIEF
jgi:D-3-phosphoglycerate dehydrogenase